MRRRSCAASARITTVSDSRSSPNSLSRRELLGTAIAAPLLKVFGQRGTAQLPTLPDIRNAPYRVVGGPGAERLRVTHDWGDPNTCKSRIHNPTDTAVAVKEIVLFELSLRLEPETALVYGEGFQMLSQTVG